MVNVFDEGYNIGRRKEGLKFMQDALVEWRSREGTSRRQRYKGFG